MKCILPYLIGFLITGCGIDKPAFTQINSQTMTVRTDISLLSQRIKLPEGVKTANWVVLPLGNGDSTVPSPTDTVLYAFLTFNNNNWSTMKPLSENSLDTPTPELPEKVAQQILPNIDSPNLTYKGDQIQVQGIQYNPNYFNKGVYRGIYAVKTGEGLLIRIQTF